MWLKEKKGCPHELPGQPCPALFLPQPGDRLGSGIDNHGSPLEKGRLCFLGQELLMGTQVSSWAWLNTYSLDSFLGRVQVHVFFRTSLGWEIKRENIRKRREQATPGSEVGKAGGSTDRHDTLVLLPPSTERRQHFTPSFSLTCLKFLPLDSALLSSDSSVLMPNPPSTQHSCPQSLSLPWKECLSELS